jgi:3D (Asp-Asp-Asp) domain-containing protein
MGTVAVDPRYIPYGTRMFIIANDGSYVYGISEAEDCGGAIKGDRVDLYFPTYAECMEFGWRNCTIYFLG